MTNFRNRLPSAAGSTDSEPSDITEEQALEMRRRVSVGERTQVTSRPTSEREVHLALVEQIARKHLDAAFTAIARDIALQSGNHWAVSVQERDRIATAMRDSFTESWGNRQGRQQYISRERYAQEEDWLNRMAVIMVMTREEIENNGINMPTVMTQITAGPLVMGIDHASEALAGELARELDSPPTAQLLASMWRRRRGTVSRTRRGAVA